MNDCHCAHVEEMVQIRRWFVITIRVLAFLGPFAGAGVAIVAMVTK